MLLRYRRDIEIIRGMYVSWAGAAIRVRRFIFRLSLIITGDFPSRPPRRRDVIMYTRVTLVVSLEHHRKKQVLQILSRPVLRQTAQAAGSLACNTLVTSPV